MALRSTSIRRSSPLRQFGFFFTVFVCTVILATLIVVLSTNPQLRKAAAWMPYDIGSEIRTSGMVEEVRDFRCPWSGTELGTHLVLRTTEGTMEVHLADAKFLRAYGIIFAKGDQIEVLGAKVASEGRKALIAREVTHGRQRFVFRDSRGQAPVDWNTY